MTTATAVVWSWALGENRPRLGRSLFFMLVYVFNEFRMPSFRPFVSTTTGGCRSVLEKRIWVSWGWENEAQEMEARRDERWKTCRDEILSMPRSAELPVKWAAAKHTHRRTTTTTLANNCSFKADWKLLTCGENKWTWTVLFYKLFQNHWFVQQKSIKKVNGFNKKLFNKSSLL